ncbi:MAG: hypothetical protein GWP08_09360 [Nitrospiraceae bacterium]|nr:hypothetical protein [Nitrospiraceae bacterium]
MMDHRDRQAQRAVAIGVVLWVCFCVAIVVVRGVRWDETYEHAQVITRQVPYPDGHPLFRYCRSAFSLQTFLSAGMLSAGMGPAAICGFRNVLLLLSTVLPVFLFGAWLSRSALWGHVAALLALSGLFLEFDGSYPFAIWPGVFSNGPVGGLYALVTVYCLLNAHWRTAFLLVGLMPCVHIGQAPPVWGLAAVCAAWGVWRGEGRKVAQGMVFAAIGLAICAAFFLFVRRFHVPAPIDGPFFSAADPLPIWRAYTASDIHRLFPPGNGQLALMGFLILTSLAALDAWRRTRSVVDGPAAVHAGLLIYGAGIAVAVWGIMLVHYAMGQQVPFLLVGWMPYRLINHIAPLLLAAVVGVLGDSRSTREARTSRVQLLLLGALAYILLAPLFPRIVGEEVYRRYLAASDGVFFALYGAAFGVLAVRLTRTRRDTLWIVALGIVLLAGLAWYHQFGAACVAAGLGASLVLSRVPRRETSGSIDIVRSVALALMLVLFAVIFVQQWRDHDSLPRSAFDKRVTFYLAESGEDTVMLAAQPDEFLLQARTGHPVLVETATASLMSYAPALGPGIDKVYGDVYGIHFGPRSHGEPPAKPWREVWSERARAEWVRLSEEYGFGYVVAYDGLELDLPVIFRDGGAALFAVPAAP